jgi:tRNA(Ile2) C34 agmatinyltransferase TiaS
MALITKITAAYYLREYADSLQACLSGYELDKTNPWLEDDLEFIEKIKILTGLADLLEAKPDVCIKCGGKRYNKSSTVGKCRACFDAAVKSSPL